MKDTTKKILKILAIVIAFAIIISSVFIIRSCTAPPEYEEIRARVEELIEASFDVNDVIWGEGLPTYERVMAPTMKYIETDKTYTDDKGEEHPLNFYYYYVSEVEKKNVIAYRERHVDAVKEGDFRYAYLTNEPKDVETLSSLFPLVEGQTAAEGLYSAVFTDESAGKYAYSIPYVEKTYDFYYTIGDPADYDYVRQDSKYASVDSIREYVRTVYSEEYAESLESFLFVGYMEGDWIQKAHYDTYESSRGEMLAKLNAFEPLFKERRVYLYETAAIDRKNSNNSYVVVDFSTYLPSNPDKIEIASIAFTLQDGVWYLATPTY